MLTHQVWDGDPGDCTAVCDGAWKRVTASRDAPIFVRTLARGQCYAGLYRPLARTRLSNEREAAHARTPRIVWRPVSARVVPSVCPVTRLAAQKREKDSVPGPGLCAASAQHGLDSDVVGLHAFCHLPALFCPLCSLFSVLSGARVSDRSSHVFPGDLACARHQPVLEARSWSCCGSGGPFLAQDRKKA